MILSYVIRSICADEVSPKKTRIRVNNIKFSEKELLKHVSKANCAMTKRTMIFLCKFVSKIDFFNNLKLTCILTSFDLIHTSANMTEPGQDRSWKKFESEIYRLSIHWLKHKKTKVLHIQWPRDAFLRIFLCADFSEAYSVLLLIFTLFACLRWPARLTSAQDVPRKSRM